MNTSNSDETTSPWDELFPELLEIIFGKLWIGDRVRLKLVCKSWNRILIQSRIPTAPEAPWEILSDEAYNNPESYSTHISLKSLSEDRIYRFKFPMLDHNGGGGGGWLCAYSRGWLVLAIGSNLNPDILLWNPLSGATRKLPPLSTLPFFQEYEDFAIRGKTKFQIYPNVIRAVEIFSIGFVDCVVAVLFQTCRGQRIALCTPREAKWILLNTVLDEENGQELNMFEHILFDTSKGKLIALAIYPGEMVIEDFTTECANKFEVSLMDCQIQVEIKFVNANKSETRIQIWRLLESSSNYILCIGAELETDGKELFTKSRELKVHTAKFVALSSEPHIYKKEAIFIGETGSFTIPKVDGILPECVYFAMDTTFEVGPDKELYTIRERGQYGFKVMQQYTLKSYWYPTCASKIGWFMPQLFML